MYSCFEYSCGEGVQLSAYTLFIICSHLFIKTKPLRVYTKRLDFFGDLQLYFILLRSEIYICCRFTSVPLLSLYAKINVVTAHTNNIAPINHTERTEAQATTTKSTIK